MDVLIVARRMQRAENMYLFDAKRHPRIASIGARHLWVRTAMRELRRYRCLPAEAVTAGLRGNLSPVHIYISTCRIPSC